MTPRSFLFLLFVPFAFAQAQQETLIGDGIESGGFGGPVLKVSPINGKTGILFGGRGGWIINHTFVLGGGGYGLVSNVAARKPGPRGEPYIDFAYGGLELEYINQWEKVVHFSVGVFLGVGGVGTRWSNDSKSGDSETVFVTEPWVSGNLNVADFFQISLGGSYRWVTGSHSPAAGNSDLSGIAGNLLLRFGSF